MGDYYDLSHRVLFFDFFYDFTTMIWFTIYGVYLSIRIARCLNQYYIDILKLGQLLLALIICIRSVVIFWIQVFKYKDQTEIILSVIFHSLNCKMFFILLTQFSWFIMIKHIEIYGTMINGRSFSDWKTQIHKIEKVGILIILSTNIAYNMMSAIMKATGIYFNILILSGIKDMITFIYSLILTIIEFYLYRDLKLIMSSSLNFHYKNFKNSIRYLSVINFWFLIELNVGIFINLIYSYVCDYIQDIQCSKAVSEYFML